MTVNSINQTAEKEVVHSEVYFLYLQYLSVTNIVLTLYVSLIRLTMLLESLANVPTKAESNT